MGLTETKKEVEFLRKQAQEKEKEWNEAQEREREEQNNLKENLRKSVDFSRERSRNMRNRFKKSYRGKEDYAQFDYGSGFTSGESTGEYTEQRSFVERKGINKIKKYQKGIYNKRGKE